MALFKPFRGSRASLDAQPLHDGYAYFCTDDGSFHIDFKDADGKLQRKQLNANNAESLVGMSWDEIQEEFQAYTDTTTSSHNTSTDAHANMGWLTSEDEISDSLTPIDADTLNGRDAAYFDNQIAVERARINQFVALEDGSTTGDAELQDIRVGYNGIKYTTAGEAVRTQMSEFAYSFKKRRNLINPDKIITGYLDNSGKLTASANYSVSELIPVKPLTTYWYSLPSRNNVPLSHSQNKCRFIAFYSESGVYVSNVAEARGDFTTPEGVAFVRLTMYNNGLTAAGAPGLFEGTIGDIIAVNIHPYGYDYIGETDENETDVVILGKNLFDKSKAEHNGMVSDKSIQLYAVDGCSTTDYIPVFAGVSYTVSPDVKAYSLYDVNKDMVKYFTDGTVEPVIITPDRDGYLRVSVSTNYLNTLQVEEGTVATSYEPYGGKFVEGIDLSNSQKEYVATEIEEAIGTVQQEMSELEETVDAKIQNSSMAAIADLFMTNNLFSGVEKVEGAYYSYGKESANSRYDYFKGVYLPAGTYTILPAARFVYIEATGETLEEESGSGATITPFTLTLGTDSICHISVYSESSYATFVPEYKLFSNEYTEDEVGPAGVYTLNEEKVKIESLDELQEETARTLNSVSTLLNAFSTKNLFTGVEMVEDAFFAWGYEQSSSEMTVHYNYFKNVYLSAGTYTVYPRARFVRNLTTDETIVESSTTTFTLDADAVCNITVYAADSNYKLFSSEYTADDVESIGDYTLAENIHTSGSSGLYEYRNMLTDKVWYACGDSFTASVSEKFDEGAYAGQNKVYPFFIGRRCGIKVRNLAVGGQTMAAVEGMTNCFSKDIYKNVGADANYITIRLGINDDNKNVPIGTINDTDNTTFYGSWNVVMEYLITNHPFAHIGIIVPNGADSDYVEAVKAIAVKWGVPYLDFATGEQTPLLHRTQRTEVCSTARNLRHNAFIVGDGDTHPNADAHEYQSYCIENWLMSL